MMPFIQDAAVAHPLDGTSAEWIWVVLMLPALGAMLNGIIAAISEWRPGPYDPDRKHWGHGGIGVTGEHRIRAKEDDVAGVTEELRSMMAHAHSAGETASTGSGDHPAVEEEPHDPDARHRWFYPVSIVGVGVMLAAFGLALAIYFDMRGARADEAFVRSYFTWMEAGRLKLDAALWLDQLSMVMTLIITGVGALIHLFSVGYMGKDGLYARYFMYLNLFVFFMLLLVLGSSYPVMFVGWEGVGLCSYLLIGFWFTVKSNADAGKKAFVVNRIGDFGMLVAMFLMFANWKALDYAGVSSAVQAIPNGDWLVTGICLLLFLGCTGKSAQIPLYTWLPDAMAGPTPVSALIHAATMVTAGVYLIARSGFLFALAPAASLTVVAVGALTALFAATIGLKQWDIKKVLAYSTVSQLGYMFVAVGAGAYVAGVFHLTTHAFFKALLFLGAGSVIHAMHHAYHKTRRHEDAQDMRNMGGLAKFLPVTCVTMWIGTLAIAGIPPFSGFFSKDEILASTFARAHGTTLAEASWLGIPGNVVMQGAWLALTIAAAITAVYMTRMMWYTFHGENRTGPGERGELHESPWVMTVPLVALAIAAMSGGWLNLPKFFTDAAPVGQSVSLEHWLEPVVGQATAMVGHGEAPHLAHNTELMLVAIATLIAIGSVAFALYRFRSIPLVPAKEDKHEERGFWKVLQQKYYVDEIYDALILRPGLAISNTLFYKGIDRGLIDGLTVNGLGWRIPWLIGKAGSALQNGRVSTYVWVLLIGAVAVLGAVATG
ncbi:MAG TPA: NADH-quinone oxidoreductase subunit L [Gemmatimonadaceae bacterium]|nr:NADH-quinone oxidoreductase subunit L [Gemmatimonadaceae bacterium]